MVVVSALAKVTDQLLRAATAAASGDRTGALAISSRLRCRHRDTATALLKNSAELVTLIDQKIDSRCKFCARPRGHSRADTAHLRPRPAMVSGFRSRTSPQLSANAAWTRCTWTRADVIVTDSQFGKAVPQDGIIESAPLGEELLYTSNSKKCRVMGGLPALE